MGESWEVVFELKKNPPPISTSPTPPPHAAAHRPAWHYGFGLGPRLFLPPLPSSSLLAVSFHFFSPPLIRALDSTSLVCRIDRSVDLSLQAEAAELEQQLSAVSEELHEEQQGRREDVEAFTKQLVDERLVGHAFGGLVTARPSHICGARYGNALYICTRMIKHGDGDLVSAASASGRTRKGGRLLVRREYFCLGTNHSVRGSSCVFGRIAATGTGGASRVGTYINVKMMLQVFFFLSDVVVGARAEGDDEKEGLRQTLQMLQKELGDQQGLLNEVRRNVFGRRSLVVNFSAPFVHCDWDGSPRASGP